MMGRQQRDQGRPSIDAELMIRMLIVGYCYGIRSERRLCQEVELHLAYRWFCKLDLEDKIPHHSTFSENRLTSIEGIALGGMCLVNYPGSWEHVYWPLVHANWHGATPADFIFPAFLFAAGLSVAYSGLTFSGTRQSGPSLYLKIARRDDHKLILLIVAGFCGIAGGLAWHPWFPINKTLWTSSFVLLTTGVSCLVLAACYALNHVARWGMPFQVLGANALAAYIAAELGARLLAADGWWHLSDRDGRTGVNLQTFLYERLFSSWTDAYLASLLYAPSSSSR